MIKTLEEIFCESSSNSWKLAKSIEIAISQGFSFNEIDEFLFHIGYGDSRKSILTRIFYKKKLTKLEMELRSFELNYYNQSYERMISQLTSHNDLKKINSYFVDFFNFSRDYPRKLELPKKLIYEDRVFNKYEKQDFHLLVDYIWNSNSDDERVCDIENELINHGCPKNIVKRFLKSFNINNIAIKPKSLEALKIIENNCNPLIYLRSFEDEKKQSFSFLTVLNKIINRDNEKIIVNQLNKYGQFIALGIPNELSLNEYDLNLNGLAARLYLPLNNWKDVIRQLLIRAERVIIRVNETDGVIWELIEALRLTEIQRIIVIFPENTGKQTYKLAKKIIYNHLQKNLGHVMYSKSNPLIMSFQSNGFPKFIYNYKNLHKAFNHTSAEETNRYIFNDH